MRIVPTSAQVPKNKVTSKGFTYDGILHKMALESEVVTIQNTPAPQITVTHENYAAMRKIYGGDRNMYAVGTVSAHPDNFGDFIRAPKPPFVIPNMK